ncbi:MAG: FAD-dependent monooxygenase [Pseudomonadales bacterium]
MTHRVLIVGGGIGGLAAALSLAARGIEVQVFEQAPTFSEVGAGIQLSPNCSRVLHGLGLAEALAAVAFLPEGTEMRQWRTGRLITRTPLGEVVRDRYGAPYYHVHRADLMTVLAGAAAAEPRIRLHPGVRIEAVGQDPESVRVTASGETFTGTVLLGADGIRSLVRETLFGSEAPTFTGNVAWRALVPADRLTDGLIRPVTTVWWGPHKHFVHYYVRRGELVNCVCVVEKRGWEVESWTERGERRELEADFAGWHPTIGTLIGAMDSQTCFKWALFDRPPMARWGQGRVTLLGDACHPTLPFMAQGAAMAIEDGAVLARCVAAGGDIVGSLARYEDLRRDRTARIQQGSRRNARVFHLSGIPALLRNRAAGRAGAGVTDWLYRYDALTAAD